jgi:acyl transferase domain-containing protein
LPGYLLTLSALSEAALQALEARYQQFLATGAIPDIASIAATTQKSRSYYPYRTAIVGESAAQLRKKLAEKTDVKAQAKSRISAVKNTAQDKRDEYVAKAKQATPESATAGAQHLTSTVQDKPLPFAVAVAFVIGLGIGWLLGRR